MTDCLQRQNQIAEEIERVQAQFESVVMRLRQGTSWGNDEADQANDLVERGEALALYQHLVQRHWQLKHAMARLDLGLDGTCEVCGQPIDLARLKAMVGVTRCIECQRSIEQRVHGYQHRVFRPRTV